MKFGNARLVYSHDGRTESLTITDAYYRQRGLSIGQERQQLKYGELLSITLASEESIELKDFSLEVTLDKFESILVNGFQTWSQSREYLTRQSIPTLFAPARPLLKPYGDYHIIRGKGRKGHFHSWSWTGYRRGESWLLLASAAEDSGYTIFETDTAAGKLRIKRDCRGQSTDNYPLLRLYIGRGQEKEVWDEYAGLLNIGTPPPRCTGWTSWYNYYTKIDEDIISSNLQALSDTGHPFQVFQIDDGWQEQIGDWLDVNDKFPSGMAALAQAIRGKGFRPGLWLAPFICTSQSRIWRENYDWVLKDEKGRPVKAGWNPGWNGWFYALDFYAPGFQTWLKQVFSTVLDQWGYQMVKLDFLYAVALRANAGRCRGRVMAEAMDFLRRACGEHAILGCGVPLAQTAGKAEYCRIGADVAPYWEDRFLKAIGYRERVSTKNSLYSTLHRNMLDRRFFRNDPDVFLLRDGKPGVNLNKLTSEQRHTLFFLNNLLGGLIFFSDHVGEYNDSQKAQLAEMFPSMDPEITSFTHKDELYTIDFRVSGREYLALSNLSSWPTSAVIPPGQWFHPDLSVLGPGQSIHLAPHQTICLVKDQRSPGLRILGSSGHIFPCAQVDQFRQDGDGWLLTLKPHSASHSKVWIALPPGNMEIRVNGQVVPAQEIDGLYIAVIPKV